MVTNGSHLLTLEREIRQRCWGVGLKGVRSHHTQPVSIKKLLIAKNAQTDALSDLLVEKGLVK